MEIHSGDTHDFEQRYELPVVFVPGIMGSRLRIHRDGDVIPWEPDRRTSIAWNFILCSSRTSRNQLDPANNTEFPQNLPGPTSGQLLEVAPPERRREYERMRGVGGVDPGAMRRRFESDVTNHLIDKGWNEVSWDFYGEFLVRLQSHTFQGGNCPVYAVGYDWRGTNSESAQRLHGRIQDIVEEENADQVVIITHSMGGLVARSYVDQYGEDLVQSVVHVTQPTYGAPVLYRRFMTGGTDMDGAMAYIMGDSREETATILGIVDGALELLPTASYRIQTTQHSRFPSWLSWDESLSTGQSFSQPPEDVAALYQETTGVLGIIPEGFEFRQDFEQRIDAAISFQSTIDQVFHSNTYWVCSRGETVDVAVRIESLEYEQVTYLGVIDSQRIRSYDGPADSHAHDYENRGNDPGIRVLHYFPDGHSDGTVPHDSQHGYSMSPRAPDPADVTQVHDVDHDQACTDDTVQQQIVDWIQTMLSNYAANVHSKTH